MGCNESKRSPAQLQKMPSLFNYKLKGEWDQEVKKGYDMQLVDIENNPFFQMTQESVETLRQIMNQMVAGADKEPKYQQYIEKCQTQERVFNATPFGSDNQELKVLIHRPKQFKTQQKNRPCIIYAHGGGGFMCQASQFSSINCRIALDNDCVCVNIDYRLAPQAKAPKGTLDCYAVIKWAIKSAQELGIDSKRICLMGDSGGGCLICGACIKLVENNEADLIKLLVPVVPITS